MQIHIKNIIEEIQWYKCALYKCGSEIKRQEIYQQQKEMSGKKIGKVM